MNKKYIVQLTQLSITLAWTKFEIRISCRAASLTPILFNMSVNWDSLSSYQLKDVH